MTIYRRISILLGAFGILAACLCAQTAQFPSALATNATLLNAYDRGETTLSAAVGASDLSLPVTDASKLPSGATNFSATIENERILVCSVSGNTFNVCSGGRGFSSSTAAAHPIGAAVKLNYTAWHHNAVKAEVQAMQTFMGINGANLLLASQADTAGTANTIAKRDSAGQLTSPQFNGALNGNALTASALASNPANCSTAGQFPTGVSASGVAENCAYPDWAYLANKPVRQLNVGVYDPNIALAATASTVWFWSPVFSAATITEVKCFADTADLVISLISGASNVLNSNMTCGNNTWNTPVTTFATASVPISYGLGFKIISGTATRLTLAIKYTGNY